MGQTASRNRTPPSPATVSTVSTENNDIVSDDSIDGIPQPAPTSRRSARSSVRRSLLNLVKPRFSQTQAQETVRPTNSRKSWRTSRRWSKATPALIPDVIPPPSTSRLPAAPTVIEKPTETLLPIEDSDDVEPPLSQPHAETDSQMEPYHTHSNDSGAWFADENITPSTSDDQGAFVPDHFAPLNEMPDIPEDVSPAPTIHQSDQSAASPPAGPQRQFPPPGTLVVVQGVVHTTDVPRHLSEGAHDEPESPSSTAASNPSAPIPRPSTPDSNNEHSSSLNQLSSRLRSRPVSMASVTDVAPVSEPAMGPTAAALEELSQTTPLSPPSPPSESPAPSGPISSSSIDVLGTLLSVAAAATAASLLTGSSEPILSSGLNPPTPAESPPPLSDQAIRPLSPTPSSVSADIMGSRTDRMRQAWSSIRERLGMRPPRSDRADDRMEAGDARERMLAEMARAFNFGLGIPPTGNDENLAPSSRTEDPEPGPPGIPTPSPAEGSFERFLIDLQLDLRVTLSQRRDSVEETEQNEPSESSSLPGSGQVNPDDTWQPRPPAMSNTSEPTRARAHNATMRLDEDEDDMPGLEDVSDSDSDSGDDDDRSFHEEPTREAPSPDSSIPPLHFTEPSRPSDRINWWRLYRFPPIPAPRGALEINLRSPGALPGVSLAPSMADVTSAPSVSTSPSSPTPANAPLPPPNVVVPVIVVGLQSVNVHGNWPPTYPTDSSDNSTTPAPTEDGTSPSARPDTLRGRRWHSRAANAFRTLRPGRRSDAPGQQTDAEPTGSRTFLIYVIGGYYPPDHSIVTGEPHNLDSFEALLDLAEILGQVKLPTASKEDIERSDLEVIKANKLSLYEQDRKISSNCTERCLICLDDYAPEDDVRVMVCKHAFHKGCVDTWLLTGKNNCPACRGTGVSTSEVPVEPLAAAAAE